MVLRDTSSPSSWSADFSNKVTILCPSNLSINSLTCPAASSISLDSVTISTQNPHCWYGRGQGQALQGRWVWGQRVQAEDQCLPWVQPAWCASYGRCHSSQESAELPGLWLDSRWAVPLPVVMNGTSVRLRRWESILLLFIRLNHMKLPFLKVKRTWILALSYGSR